MRNYFKLHTSWVHGRVPPLNINTTELVGWAADDETLMVLMQAKVAVARAAAPGMVFEWYGPFIVWFELNEANFLMIINSIIQGKQVGLMVWENTRLATPATATFSDRGEQFYEITKVKSQGSPRKTWSHGR